MAQSAVTVRIDSEVKSQFDKVCEQIGMSANTAFNVFVKAVVRTRSIPFEIKASQNSANEDFKKAFYALRESARKNGLQDMTLEEINEEIRQPEKHQVFFHRRTEGVLTENTEFWQKEKQRLISAANSGDVLVTPGISECEKRIKNMALEQKLRLIHVQADPIGRYWKPERSRFKACAYGSLLVLAPWPEDMPAFTSDYDRFHYLNRLAEDVCAISHVTHVAVQGLRPSHGG